MGLWKSIAGTLTVELTSADPAAALTAIQNAGLPLLHVAQTGPLTLEIDLYRSGYRVLAGLAERRGETLKLLRRRGLYWTGKRLLGRPLLLGGTLLLVLLILYLPSRIFFVRVEGNDRVPTRLILAQAEECGIRFGASRREVRSERMKNALLGAIPELQWAGVNTSGCVATISVRERSPAEETEQKSGVSSIVAVQDGVITQTIVWKGNLLCKTGQAVKAGETLISGYTDCGLSIQATRAQGEIYAQTQRTVQAVEMDSCLERGEVTGVEKKYSLRIGKKLINFSKNSGILDAGCDKMSLEHVLTLPGGFTLPVALIEERITHYAVQTCEVPEAELLETAAQSAQQYVLGQMIAGQILEQQEQMDQNAFYGKYACLEMIGREQSEEIIQSNGENH